MLGGGFLCCQVKRSVLVRCLFGVDVWNFQEVRLLDAVVFKNWQWTVKCIVGWCILSWILLSDCCVSVLDPRPTMDLKLSWASNHIKWSPTTSMLQNEKQDQTEQVLDCAH